MLLYTDQSTIDNISIVAERNQINGSILSKLGQIEAHTRAIEKLHTELNAEIAKQISKPPRKKIWIDGELREGKQMDLFKNKEG